MMSSGASQKNMLAAVLDRSGPVETAPLTVKEVDVPTPGPHEVLLKVLACGVCHTDLHLVEGDLPRSPGSIIPGHQIVGEVVKAPEGTFQIGQRLGVAWLGGTDGTCRYCRAGRENLCDQPIFTGYTHHGGFAQYATADARFAYPIPEVFSSVEAAPLLCAGAVGFRSLRVAEVKPGERVGLFGFGASAQMCLPVLQAWGCEIFVSTREVEHQAVAQRLGAHWVGGLKDKIPVVLDAAITFAPVGSVAVTALGALAKGGILAINAIHLDEMPAFDYDSLLWGERQIRSVANLTRSDAADYLTLIASLNWRPEVTACGLADLNSALKAIRDGSFSVPFVVLPNE